MGRNQKEYLLRDYELVVLIDSDLELDLDKPLKKVEKIIKDNGGKVVKTDVWGKRKLAYPINKKDFAIYVYMDIQLEPSEVSEIESNLNIAKEVVRYIITNPVPEVVFPGREPKEDDEKAESSESEKEEE